MHSQQPRGNCELATLTTIFRGTGAPITQTAECRLDGQCLICIAASSSFAVLLALPLHLVHVVLHRLLLGRSAHGVPRVPLSARSEVQAQEAWLVDVAIANRDL